MPRICSSKPVERDQITILRHDKKSMGDIAKSLVK